MPLARASSPFLSPVFALPDAKPSTMISFMERGAEGREENATNDITLSLNNYPTHDIIITRDGDAGEPIRRPDLHISLEPWWEIY